MTEYALDLWVRSLDSLRVARHVADLSPDIAASRAYYAAFYSVSAMLALAGRTFTRHIAVEAALHRDLIKAGALPSEVGKDYARLAELRSTGDYGGGQHVSAEAAREALLMAARIVEAIREQHPDVFTSAEKSE